MDGFADLIVFESDWMTFVFLAILLLITIAKFTFSEGLSQTASLFISKKYLLINFTKEKNNILNPFQGLLFCVQIFSSTDDAQFTSWLSLVSTTSAKPLRIGQPCWPTAGSVSTKRNYNKESNRFLLIISWWYLSMNFTFLLRVRFLSFRSKLKAEK